MIVTQEVFADTIEKGMQVLDDDEVFDVFDVGTIGEGTSLITIWLAREVPHSETGDGLDERRSLIVPPTATVVRFLGGAS